MNENFTPLSKLKLSHVFMFAQVMRQEPITKLFLEELLNTKIERIEFIQKEVDLSDSYLYHGIRLDVYLGDDAGTKYNIEMQKPSKDDLARRARYYQSGIDRSLLDKGLPYTKLPNSYVIFVCDYDYFGGGYAVYHRESVVKETGEPYVDGSHAIFLNTKYTEENVSAAIKEFLACVRDIDAPGMNIATDLGRMAVKLVDGVRKDKEKEVLYMTYMQHILEQRQESQQNLNSCLQQLKDALIAANRTADFLDAIGNAEKIKALCMEVGLIYPD